MQEVEIRTLTKTDLPLLDIAMRKLSEVLGDEHLADVNILERGAFSNPPAFYALLAVQNSEALGAVMFSPVFSTTNGSAGLYVSDLWVAESSRGKRLGQRLLKAAANQADTLWHARFLLLNVYDTSPDARRFYEGLGMVAKQGQETMILDKNGLHALKGT